MRDVIICDLDSTIINTSLSIINLYNKLNNNKIEYIENHSWNWYPMIKAKEELSEVFKLFDNKDFYGDTLVVFPDAIEVINELSKNNRVIIATKHDESRRSISREYIYKTFPNVELVFLDSFDKSCVVKNMLIDKPLCFIDDRPDALMSMQGLVPHLIAYNTYQWNEDWEGLRANNWKELYKMIKNIQIQNNKLIKNVERMGEKRWEI